MPDWIMGPVCLIGLVGFIFYAFRQGFAVKPDRNNKNVGPTTNDTWLASGRGSEDGHTL
jgi:hypothetical protein